MSNIMEENKQNLQFGEEIAVWEVPEYIKHERTKNWYIVAIIVTALLVGFSIYTKNFLFLVIVFISAYVIFVNDRREPDKVRAGITTAGVFVGKKFYEYESIKDFSVVFKPQEDVRNIYFEFKNGLKQRLSIPLENQNPLHLRENLLKYLPEDLERTNQPLSEGLARLFKL
jgi:hypothetical protein